MKSSRPQWSGGGCGGARGGVIRETGCACVAAGSSMVDTAKRIDATKMATWALLLRKTRIGDHFFDRRGGRRRVPQREERHAAEQQQDDYDDQRDGDLPHAPRLVACDLFVHPLFPSTGAD